MDIRWLLVIVFVNIHAQPNQIVIWHPTLDCTTPSPLERRNLLVFIWTTLAKKKRPSPHCSLWRSLLSPIHHLSTLSLDAQQILKLEPISYWDLILSKFSHFLLNPANSFAFSSWIWQKSVCFWLWPTSQLKLDWHLQFL